jgi:inhibitor of cysteine peptidase
MKWLMLTVMFLTVLVVAACGHGGPTSTVTNADGSIVSGPTSTVTNADGSTTVSLHLNQIMTVSLQGNGSTGYMWDVLPGAESILAQQGASQFVSDSNAPGSGGMYQFMFKAIASGTAKLNLIYHRPFETGIAPMQTFEITAVVGS